MKVLMSVITESARRLVVVWLLLPGLAYAQPSPEPQLSDPLRIRSLEQKLEELEQSHRILERKLELQQEAGEEARKRGVTFTAAPGKGLTLTTNDNKFSMTWRARAQIRNTLTYAEAPGVQNELNVKTMRLVTTGHVLTPDLKYAIQLAFGTNDFEAGNPSPLFDAYVEYTRLRDLNIRVGQYFVPFDRARTIREFALQLVDRQQVVTELTLDRDVGLTLSSNDLGGAKGRVGYALFVGGGEGKNRFGAQRMGGLYIGRFIIRPWGNFDDDQEGDLLRLRRPRMAIGLAAGYNQATNRPRSTTGTAFTLGSFDYVHAAGDLVFKYAGFSFLGEVVMRKSFKPYNDGTDANMMPLREWSRSGIGYFVQAGMMLGKYVEIAARWDHLRTLGTTDPALVKLVAETGKQAGAGLNVYLNGHAFKFQTDYFYIFGDDPSKGRSVWRLQLDASF
jgi:hypothetical protein